MKRVQLTLFVTGPVATELERVRAVVDPVHHRLIPAHVTLCREDELQPADAGLLAERCCRCMPFELTFDRAERFGEHGIRLRGGSDHAAFSAMRQHVLGRTDVRAAIPHITLAHPRNPLAAGNDVTAGNALLPFSVAFREAALIQQLGAGAPWQVVARFAFDSKPPNPAPH